MQRITASKLYSYTQCPHRVWRDSWGPQEEKAKEINSFVELLWQKGVSHEEKVIRGIGEYLDLSEGELKERQRRTNEALEKKEPLIYQGVLQYSNMFGIPDLLRLEGAGQYVPIEIKSGMAYEASDDNQDDYKKPKKSYAVQLGLYSEILQGLGFENKKFGKVIYAHVNEVDYDLNQAVGKRDKTTLWEFYEKVKNNVEVLIDNEDQNKPALSGVCKLCPWYASCKKWVNESDDLTRLYYVGRGKRDVIDEDLGVSQVDELLKLDIEDIIMQKKSDKNFLKGIGEKTILKIRQRADVMVNKKEAVVYKKIEFPKVKYELFFDIEDDPTQEYVYMHGVYEKSVNGERYVHFTAREVSADAEKKVWTDFWNYIRSMPQDDYSVYYYSAHEKTTYKKMQKLYPDVVSQEELDNFFENANVIDLFEIVNKYTDWPLSSYSIKEIAQFLGFRWRDETPSGALSIQWFNDYIERCDDKILHRLLKYNEDDCKATMVVKEGIESISNNLYLK